MHGRVSFIFSSSYPIPTIIRDHFWHFLAFTSLYIPTPSYFLFLPLYQHPVRTSGILDSCNDLPTPMAPSPPRPAPPRHWTPIVSYWLANNPWLCPTSDFVHCLSSACYLSTLKMKTAVFHTTVVNIHQNTGSYIS